MRSQQLHHVAKLMAKRLDQGEIRLITTSPIPFEFLRLVRDLSTFSCEEGIDINFFDHRIDTYSADHECTIVVDKLNGIANTRIPKQIFPLKLLDMDFPITSQNSTHLLTPKNYNPS